MLYPTSDEENLPLFNPYDLVVEFRIEKPEGPFSKSILRNVSPETYQKILEVVEHVELPTALAAAGFRIRMVFERIPAIG